MTKSHKKKRALWLDWTFSVIILSLIITGATLLFISGKNNTASGSEDYEQTIPTPTVVNLIDSPYPDIRIVTETSNDAFAPFTIQYPQSLHQPFNEAVTAYIHKIKSNYVKTMESSKVDEEGKRIHGELNISYKTTTHNSGNHSFIVTSDFFSGDAHSFKEKQAFQLNPETGHQLTVSELFDQESDSLSELEVLIEGSLTSDDVDFSDEAETTEQLIWDTYNTFSLTDEEIIFYFTQDQYKERTPVAKLLIEDVNELLVSPFKIKPKKGPTDKYVALTFDDGPHPTVTREVLDILNKHDAIATFFMLGSRVEAYPDIAKEIYEAGHELGNHSWSHPNLTRLNVDKVSYEINNTTDVIEFATGERPTAFRPPYGAFNDNVSNEVEVPIVLWDVDTLDWKYRNSNKIFNVVKRYTRDGSNILMHDIHQETADALDNILTYLTNEGYTFVTVSELE